MKRLSKPQERVLLWEHISGGVSGRFQWKTYEALEKHGMLDLSGKNIVVTQKGRDYCDKYHIDIKL
jgi:ribosomal protein S19E (S16A)